MRRLLLATLVVGGSILVAPLPAAAVYRCGAQTDDCQCGRDNPYPCCDNGGNCTWWAWEAACCTWGVGLPGWGNANQWRGNAQRYGYDVRSCWDPYVNTIANRVSGTYGHVAWTEGLNGGAAIRVSEQSCDYGPGSMRHWNYGACWFDGGFIAQGGQVQCRPGDTQSQACGPCGYQTRGCNANGQWGGWGGCVGTGECSPGQVDERACCDCGRQRRTCDGACHWSGLSACEGPDPQGPAACSTGQPGVCDEGRTRCVSGCLSCVQVNGASPEACDGLDNDCDGSTDEGSPPLGGAHRPRFAASVVDASYPRSMASGETSPAWVLFRNDGTETWRAHTVSLRADASLEGRESALAPAHGWAAFDTARVVDHDVRTGETIALAFPITMGADRVDLSEHFTLLTPDGTPIACPEPTATLEIAAEVPASGPAALTIDEGRSAPAADGCVTAPAASLALLTLLAARRRPRKS